jgi:hypothetical protein
MAPAEIAKVGRRRRAGASQAQAPTTAYCCATRALPPGAPAVGRLPKPASSACSASQEPAAQSSRTNGEIAGGRPSRPASTAAPSSSPTRPNGRAPGSAGARGTGAAGRRASSRWCSIKIERSTSTERIARRSASGAASGTASTRVTADRRGSRSNTQTSTADGAAPPTTSTAASIPRSTAIRSSQAGELVPSAWAGGGRRAACTSRPTESSSPCSRDRSSVTGSVGAAGRTSRTVAACARAAPSAPSSASTNARLAPDTARPFTARGQERAPPPRSFRRETAAGTPRPAAGPWPRPRRRS